VPEGWPRHDGVLLALLASFPVALIALPRTPIFGGTKHFIAAYPFLALAAALAWSRLWSAARVRSRVVEPIALALCLGPAALATIAGHPYNLSQYAPLVGGPRGAADLGLNRGFWGHAVVSLLPELERLEPDGGPIYIHDIHGLAHKQYVREGRWPDGLRPSPISRASLGLLFHERHMATYEHRLWNRFGTTVPARVITLHDVPLTSLYVANEVLADHARP
jgi:hypothetical protein